MQCPGTIASIKWSRHNQGVHQHAKLARESHPTFQKFKETLRQTGKKGVLSRLKSVFIVLQHLYIHACMHWIARDVLISRISVSHILWVSWIVAANKIDHFWVHLSLHFKARVSAKSLLRKSVFIHIEIGTNYHHRNFALTLALKERMRGTRKWPIKLLEIKKPCCKLNKVAANLK